MNLARLREELEADTHAGRMRRMVDLGRASAHDPSIAPIIEALGLGDFSDRLMALQSCYGSGDGDRAASAVSDPSRIIRRRALRLVARFSDDDRAVGAYRAARRDDRPALLRHLRGRRRTGPADAIVGEIATLGDDGDDDAMARLLPFASGPVAARHLDRGGRWGGPTFWGALARHHPDLAAGALLDRALAATGPDARLLRKADAGLRWLAESRPDSALRIVDALRRHVPLGRIAWHGLPLRRPAEVADRLLGSDEPASIELGRVAHRLDAARLGLLIRRRPEVLPPQPGWFGRLAPADRVVAFEAGSGGWRDLEGGLPPWMIALLPGELRHTQARIQIGRAAMATRPAARFAYASLLPWDEARGAVGPWIGHPEGELRAGALAALIGAVRYHRDRMDEALALVEGRRNEQDPVRWVMLGTLAGLPTAAFGAGHLDAIGRVVQAALDAADLSEATAASAERIIVKLLPGHPDWGAKWLEVLARSRGQLFLAESESRLTDAQVRRLAPALAPILEAWRTREREPQLWWLALALARRLRAFDALLSILENLVRTSKADHIVENCLALIGRHDRGRFAALVPDLLESDPSWATRPSIYLHLHRRRQDLLTPFLGHRAYQGRFSSGEVRVVPPHLDGFERWTANQRSIFAGTLLELTHPDDKIRDRPAAIVAIRQLARLPDLDVGRLVELAADDRLAVRDAAIRALGRLDADQGVPALLEAMGDDRARVAIHALRGALLGMPADRALGLLRGVRLDRVAVAKEVVRLAGELPDESAFALLVEFDARALHRDVRVALLRALWGHLERPGAWDVIDRAAAEADPAMVSGVVRIPADRLSEGSRARLAAVLDRLLAHPDPAVRLAVLGRCAEDPADDPGRRVLARALDLLGSRLPDERDAASRAVVAVAVPDDSGRVGRATASLRADRRALVGLVSRLRSEVAGDPRRLVPVARAVLEALADDGPAAALRVELGVETFAGTDLAEFLSGMAARGELHADALGAASLAIGAASGRPVGPGLDRFEAACAASPDDRVRRLAVAALVAGARAGPGWDDPRLARLRAYRADPSPLVAAAAQFTLPAAEVDGPPA